MTNRKLHMRFQLAQISMTLATLNFYISSNFRRVSGDFADLRGNNLNDWR